MMLSRLTTLLVAAAAIACGSPQHQATDQARLMDAGSMPGFVTETRLIATTRVPLPADAVLEDEAAGDGFNLQSAALVNDLAGQLITVMADDGVSFDPKLIGHALPNGVAPFATNGGEEVTHVYEKKVKSLLGLQQLLRMQFKIRYRTKVVYAPGGAVKAKNLIANVMVIPMPLEIDPLYDLKVTVVSEDPLYVAAGPSGGGQKRAQLGFVMVSRLTGLGYQSSATDSWVLKGDGEAPGYEKGDFQ